MRAPSCTNKSEAGCPRKSGAYAALVSAVKSTLEVVESSEPARIEDSPGRELAARYRKWRPPGRNCGEPCALSPRAASRDATGVGAAPARATWDQIPQRT